MSVSLMHFWTYGLCRPCHAEAFMLQLRSSMVLVVLLIAAGSASAFDFVKSTAPGKWIEPYVPEDLPEPDYPSYFNDFDKARLQAFTGQYRRALATLYKIKDADPEEAALIRTNCLQATGRYDQALAELSKPDLINRPRVQVLRARFLADIGRRDEATKLLVEHLKANPNSLDGHFFLGQV